MALPAVGGGSALSGSSARQVKQKGSKYVRRNTNGRKSSRAVPVPGPSSLAGVLKGASINKGQLVKAINSHVGKSAQKSAQMMTFSRGRPGRFFSGDAFEDPSSRLASNDDGEAGDNVRIVRFEDVFGPRESVDDVIERVGRITEFKEFHEVQQAFRGLDTIRADDRNEDNHMLDRRVILDENLRAVGEAISKRDDEITEMMIEETYQENVQLLNDKLSSRTQ